MEARGDEAAMNSGYRHAQAGGSAGGLTRTIHLAFIVVRSDRGCPYTAGIPVGINGRAPGGLRGGSRAAVHETAEKEERRNEPGAGRLPARERALPGRGAFSGGG